MDAETVLAILGTSSVTWIIQFAVTRNFHRKDTDREHDKIVKKDIGCGYLFAHKQ